MDVVGGGARADAGRIGGGEFEEDEGERRKSRRGKRKGRKRRER
jgi:hypothetical protein